MVIVIKHYATIQKTCRQKTDKIEEIKEIRFAELIKRIKAGERAYQT